MKNVFKDSQVVFKSTETLSKEPVLPSDDLNKLANLFSILIRIDRRLKNKKICTNVSK